ncbi:putative beta-1,3-galactosyltransferase 19 [Hordeum vulgare]|nr:putative beta-1,3-galactosyltransferase 19 [Hordeum vulgare]
MPPLDSEPPLPAPLGPPPPPPRARGHPRAGQGATPRRPSKRAHREALEVAPSGIVSGLDLGRLISSYSVGSLRKVATEAAAAWARVFADLHDALPDPLDASNEEGEDRVGLEIIEKFPMR